jgi:hypothetical protein
MGAQRWQVTQTEPVFRVEVNRRSQWLPMLRPLLWLTITWAGMANLPRVTGSLAGWMAALLVLVGIGGAVSLYGALWSVLGMEVIEVGTGYLWLSEQMAGRTRHSRHFRANRVEGLRVDDTPAARRLGARSWVLGSGRLAFDAAGKTYRFGTGLDRLEASRLAEELAPRLEAAREE